MLEFIHQLKMIFYATPLAKLWLVAALVLAGLILFTWRKRRAAGLAAGFIFAAACGLAFTLHLFINESATVPWRALERRALPSLTLISMEMPRTGYMFGNEPYLFLESYLRGKELVISPKLSASRFFRQQRWQVIMPQRTGSEFVFHDLIREDYPDGLTPEQVDALLKNPHFGIGHPGKNFALFILGEHYDQSRRIYLYQDGRQYIFLPASLAPAKG